eukprot:scaffold9995_cov75-Phaeocystis_antarctica.AAC.4
MSTQLKSLVVGSKVPTQSALYGAKTTRPLPAVAAPAYSMASPLVSEAQLRSLDSCRPRPEWVSACALKGAFFIRWPGLCVYHPLLASAVSRPTRPSA